MEINRQHRMWLDKFLAATKKKSGLHELRSDIFAENLQIIETGHYFVDKKKIDIGKCSITDGTLYDSAFPTLQNKVKYLKTEISVINADCLEVADLLIKTGHNPSVLNMASRHNPGGGVFDGSGAQEENLFRRTNLYTSLFQYVDYGVRYGVVRNPYFHYPLDKNFGAIYTPRVNVFRGAESAGYQLLVRQFQTAVISVPAISKPDLIEENGELFLQESFIAPTKEKMRIMLRLAISEGHDSLILSAFGCGAYRNPPAHIARLFREVFYEKEFTGRLKLIVFAIIEDHNSRRPHNPQGNYLPFCEVFQTSSFLTKKS